MVILILLLSFIIIAETITGGIICKKHSFARKISGRCLDSLNTYVFMIDTGVKVVYTNYFAINPQFKNSLDKEHMILGNVLRCKNGCDAGLCGKGIACTTCSIRYNITKLFQNHNDFSNLFVSMQLYTDNNNVIQTDVCINGKYLEIDNKPYAVISAAPNETLRTTQQLFMIERMKNFRMHEELNRIEKEIRPAIDVINKTIEEISDTKDESLKGELNNSIADEFSQLLKTVSDFNLFYNKNSDTDASLTKEEILTNVERLLPTVLVITESKDTFRLITDYLTSRFNTLMASSTNEIIETVISKANIYGIVYKSDSSEIATPDIIHEALSITSYDLPILAIGFKNAHSVDKEKKIIYQPKDISQDTLIEELDKWILPI